MTVQDCIFLQKCLMDAEKRFEQKMNETFGYCDYTPITIEVYRDGKIKVSGGMPTYKVEHKTWEDKDGRWK